MHDGTQDIKPKPVSELTPSREEAEHAALALGKIEHLTEICEMANLPNITVGVTEMRAVLTYVEWLVAERKETATALRVIRSLPTKYTMINQSNEEIALFDARSEAAAIADKALKGGDV